MLNYAAHVTAVWYLARRAFGPRGVVVATRSRRASFGCFTCQVGGTWERFSCFKPRFAFHAMLADAQADPTTPTLTRPRGKAGREGEPCAGGAGL
eukprot:1584653-Prymnesium_polylepis.1